MDKPKITGILKKVSSVNGKLKPVKTIIERDYNNLSNRPKINKIELKGDKSFEELGMKSLTNTEIARMFNQ